MRPPHLRSYHCEPEPSDRGSTPALAGVLSLMLVAVTFGAHYPAVLAGYTWDDDLFLYQNPLVLARDGLYRSWFTTEAPDYWPLPRTMFWLEWRIWGNNPIPYHVANIVFHAVGAVLLWRALRRMNVGEPGAYLSGVIFAIHPVTVESVAWISERKNVLSIVLYLLAILAYLRFQDRGRRRWYVFALLAGAGALLAKSSVAMLPLVLLLCIWWKEGRLTRKDILRTVPFFALSLTLGLVEVWFEHHKAIAAEMVRPEGPASRIAASGWVVWFYLYKILVPINLAMVYPRWQVDGGRVISFIPLALLIAGFGVVWYYRKSWGRGPLAALGYFVITLLPVLGLVSMSYARHSLVADHFQYAAMIGVIALAAGLVASPFSRTAWQRSGMTRAACMAAICGVVVALGTLTWRQARVYRDEETLWTHTIRINDRAWVAYQNRSSAWLSRGDYDAAIRDCNRAIEIKPDHAPAYNNRGLAYKRKGNLGQAVLDYTRALELDPGCAQGYTNRGNAYSSMGDPGRAIRDHTRAIELKPEYAEVYNNRGNVYNDIHDLSQAIRDYTKAIELKPEYAEAHYNRANTYSDMGDFSQAIRDYAKAIGLTPNYAGAYHNRAVAYFYLKEYDKARADVQMYRRLGGTPDPGLVKSLIEASGRGE